MGTGVVRQFHLGDRKEVEMPSKWIVPTRRRAIYIRDRFTCVYCEADLSEADPSEFGLDHVVPRHIARDNTNENLVTACKACNDAKNGTSLKAWLYDYFPCIDADFAVLRVDAQLAKPVNMKLAKALVNGDYEWKGDDE